MIKLKYKHLRDGDFQRAIRTIVNFKGIRDPKAIYNIMRLGKKIEQHSKDSDEVFLKMVREYAVLDEHGNIKPLDGRPGTYEVPEEKKEEWAKKIEEFVGLEFTIERYPLKLTDIAMVGLSAAELFAIEDVLDAEDLKSLDDEEGKVTTLKVAPTPQP